MSSEFSDTIDQFLDRFRAAWDAGIYAAQFTEDATYVTWRGDLLIGREAIERMHDEVFTRWSPGRKMRVSAIRIKMLGSDSCVVLTAGGLVENGPPDFDKMQTFALVQSDGRWICAAFQNTAMSHQAKKLIRVNFASLPCPYHCDGGSVTVAAGLHLGRRRTIWIIKNSRSSRNSVRSN